MGGLPRIAFVFPAASVAIALVGTVVLALVVMLAPLRRAVGSSSETPCGTPELVLAGPVSNG